MRGKTKIKTFLFLMAVLFIAGNAVAQQNVNYDNVGVIVNTNDTTSQNIGNYFKAKRNIPEKNIIRIETSTQEEINDSTFNDFATKVKNYIADNNLDLDYLVTTKGCPLKVLRAVDDGNGCNSSVEAELMLLPYNNGAEVGTCEPYDSIAVGQYLKNPYYNEVSNFAKDIYSIYLVTRLDAYTQQGVYSLIDHSGPNTYVNKDSVQFVFDRSPNWSAFPLDYGMFLTRPQLTTKGWQVYISYDSIYVTDKQNVIGYMSWGSNDGFSQHYTENAKPHFTWANGSIAETCVSTSGRSFMSGTVYGQSLIADLIQEGATGAKGYVFEPLTTAIADPTILFPRYADLDNDGMPLYNLAESYFSASSMIGWMDVVVGDPKTSVTTNAAYNSVAAVKTNSLSIYPNPGGKEFYITGNNNWKGEMVLQVFDTIGREVFHEKLAGGSDKYILNTEKFSAGIYTVRVQAGKELFTAKIAVTKP